MVGASTASGGGGTGTSCVATLALINNALSTPSVTASGSVAFYFSAPYSASGTSVGATIAIPFILRYQVSSQFYPFIPQVVFQCRLSSSTGSISGGQLHDWRSCSSPDSYNGLADGYYTFQVPYGADGVQL